MAQKQRKNKKQQQQQLQRKQLQEEKSGTNSWPILPLQLRKLIANNPVLMHNMTFEGVSKSWRSSSSNCNSSNLALPMLQLSDTDTVRLIESFSIPFPSFWQGYWRVTTQHITKKQYITKIYRRPLWETWEYIVGYSQDAVLTIGPDPSKLQAWNPVRNWFCDLPHWDATVPFKLAVVSSTEEHWPWGRLDKPCAVMVLTGDTRPAFAFFRFSENTQDNYKWVKQDCLLIDPNSTSPSKYDNYMKFTNAIGVNGKFYAMSLQGTLVIIECTDSGGRITALCQNRAVPSIPSNHFKKYLIESDGNVLLVLLICRKSREERSVVGVEILRLKEEESKLSWVKIEDLGERAVFIGDNYCICVSVSELEYESNCVYFTERADGGWWMYDIASGSISSPPEEITL